MSPLFSPPIPRLNVALPSDVLEIRAEFINAAGFKNPSLFSKASKESVSDAARVFVERAAEITVLEIRTRLTAGKKYNVGATNKAAENVGYEMTSGKDTFAAFITEGAYPGNYFILRGREGQSKEGNVAEHAPPYKVILNWLLTKKGIRKSQGIKKPERAKRWRMTKERKGKPSRPYKVDLKTVALMIARKISREGMSSHFKLPPKGLPGYNYYEDSLKVTAPLVEEAFGVGSDKYMKAYVRFLTYGVHKREFGAKRKITGNFKR